MLNCSLRPIKLTGIKPTVVTGSAVTWKILLVFLQTDAHTSLENWLLLLTLLSWVAKYIPVYQVYCSRTATKPIWVIHTCPCICFLTAIVYLKPWWSKGRQEMIFQGTPTLLNQPLDLHTNLWLLHIWYMTVYWGCFDLLLKMITSTLTAALELLDTLLSELDVASL